MITAGVTITKERLMLLAEKIDERTLGRIARAGANVAFDYAIATVPVGIRVNHRYARRKVKGKWNRPSVILQTTQPGNLKASHDIEMHGHYAYVGPRIRSGSGQYAVYATMLHKEIPWLDRAIRTGAKAVEMAMIAETQKILEL